LVFDGGGDSGSLGYPMDKLVVIESQRIPMLHEKG
jgi:hypothetical protein